MAKIINVIDARAGDHLVEIGPGLGVLTEVLLPQVGEMDAVELDRDLIPKLIVRCASLGSLHIHSADALKFDFATLAGDGRPLRIVGNLPYNISTPLLFHLLACRAPMRDMHFMLQKEVVARLAARPGGKDYGRLSVMVQVHCRVESLFDVPPAAFNPPPKVHSAVVRLTPYAEPPIAVADMALLEQVVTQAFAQRRKTLRNTLKGLLDAGAIAALDIDPARRAETLSLAEFARLADAVARLSESGGGP